MDKVIIHERGRYKPIDYGRPKPDDNWPYHGYPTTPIDPEFGIKNPKFEKHIFILRDSVIFAINTQLSMIADARKNPDGTPDETIADATTKYASMFNTWIGTHIGEAKTIMSAFVLEKSRTTAMNTTKSSDETDITLLFPEWYDDTTFQQLCTEVNNFIVNATLFDFLSLRFTSKDPVTVDVYQKLDANKAEIRKLVNMSKPGRIRKAQNPF